MKYDCVVIGAGMAGLTSALVLAKEGKKVLVLERQPVAGGVATSFKRKGFTFESALHFVDALEPEGEMRKFLDDYGVSQKIKFIDLKEFGRVVYPGHDFVADGDFETLRAMFLERFPQEELGINDFFRGIGRFYRQFDHFTSSNIPLWLKLAVSPLAYPLIIKTSCMSAEQFISKKIKDKKLRSIIGTIWGFMGLPLSKLSAFYFLIVLRGCWGRKTAYVKGGFSRLFAAMVERIRELGSEVKFNTEASQILIGQNKRVKGVRTQNKEEFFCSTLISNANSIDTLTRILDCKPLNRIYAQKLASLEKSVSAVTVYLGLDVPGKAIGMDYQLLSLNSTYDHDEAFDRCMASCFAQSNLAIVDHSQLDHDLAPAGKSALCLMTLANYSSWENLTPEEYKKKKKESADMMIAHISRYLPGIAGHIEVLEIGTPKTIERYAALPAGAIYGFAQSVAQASLSRLNQKTKAKGLFLAGAWTRPGAGVHGCLVSGKDAATFALKFLKKSGCA